MFSAQTIHQGELELLRIEGPRCMALFSRQGGQLLSYAQDGLPPLLWSNPLAAYEKGTPIRLGAPICWPWFGDLERNPEAVRTQFGHLAKPSAHGLVRQVDWEVSTMEIGGDHALVVFHTATEQSGLELCATYRFDAEGMDITLLSTNRQTSSVALSFALHTYFAVSDIAKVLVGGLEGTPYIETLEGWSERLQTGPLRIGGETDRIYFRTPQRIELQDAGLGRVILIEAPDSHSAVVWNPWIDKSRRLNQFGAQDYLGMLCIETARCWSDHLVLAAGGSHATRIRLSQRSL